MLRNHKEIPEIGIAGVDSNVFFFGEALQGRSSGGQPHGRDLVRRDLQDLLKA